MSNIDKVSPNVLALGAKIAEALTFDADGAGFLPEGFLAENLQEGITLESIVKHQNAEIEFGTALAHGLGIASPAHIKANKGLERTTATANYGTDELRASYDREQQVNVAPGSSEKKSKYGAVSLKLTSSIGAKRGDFKKVQEHHLLNGLEAFGPK